MMRTLGKPSQRLLHATPPPLARYINLFDGETQASFGGIRPRFAETGNATFQPRVDQRWVALTDTMKSQESVSFPGLKSWSITRSAASWSPDLAAP